MLLTLYAKLSTLNWILELRSVDSNERTPFKESMEGYKNPAECLKRTIAIKIQTNAKHP